MEGNGASKGDGVGIMVVRQRRRGKVQNEEPSSPALVALPPMLVQKALVGSGGGRAILLYHSTSGVAIASSARQRSLRLGQTTVLGWLAVGIVCRGCKAGLGRNGGRVSQQHQGHGLGQLLGEGIVKYKRIIPTLVLRNIVASLSDLIGLTFADPLDLLQSDGRQLLDNRGMAAVMSPGGDGGRWQVLTGIVAVRIGGGYIVTGAQDSGVAGMLEDAEIEGLFMRLNTPRDGMIGSYVQPANKIGLSK